jgi:hypothetical protein
MFCTPPDELTHFQYRPFYKKQSFGTGVAEAIYERSKPIFFRKRTILITTFYLMPIKKSLTPLGLTPSLPGGGVCWEEVC